MRLRLLIILAFIVIGVAAFSHLNPAADKTLQPLYAALATAKNWFTKSFSETSPAPQQQPTNGTTVYKWKDENGRWQFSGKPPPAGVTSSVTVYRSDTNITQAPKPAEEPTDPAPSSTEAPLMANPLMPISEPERVKQLMDDARNVQNLMDQRGQVLEEGAAAR